MDLQSALVCVLVFVVSAALLLLISMFGMREKSYEEALAEQRQLTTGLLGPGQRSKPKEKKQKKSGKKVKEKPVTVDNNGDNVDEAESVDAPEPSATGSTSGRSSSPHHVEFEEPAVVESTNPVVNAKKRNKKDKVKPILLNKEKTPVSDVDSSKIPVANHFEKIHPKDEFELLHSHKEDIPVKQEKQEIEAKPTKTKAKQVEKDANEQQKAPKTGNKEKKQSHQQQATVAEEEHQPPVVEQPVVAKSVPVAHVAVTNSNPINTVKDKKKKKSEFNTLQQMTVSDKHDINVSLLVPLVRKADLSRSEIQILIDLLLNKQHEAPAIIDEWSEGRTDPVQKLKRQLAEKERALTEEQEALVSAQAKLREVRAELNSERSRLLQNYRNLEENLHAKHTELQSAAARMLTQNQKMQQMQAQINEEAMTVHKLREELNAMQLQRQQLDIHLNQKQETEASFQSQLSQLRSELQEQQNLNAQLNMELRNVRESSHAEKEMLHERIRQTESQAVHYKNESDQRQDLVRQLEDSRRAYTELEHRLLRKETELAHRYQQLDETLRIEQAKALDESAKLQAEVGRLNHLHKQQQDEQRRIVADLQTQVSSLQSENVQLEAANGAASDDRNKEVEILNLQNELASLRVRLQQRETQLTAEIEEIKKTANNSEAELKSQREKNDELRKKNWKMVEALNSAETSLRNKRKQSVTVNDDDASLKKLKSEEQEKNRKFLQRLFPEVKLPNSDNWMSEAERGIKKHISELQREKEENNVDSSVDVARLQAQVVQYRNIIEDTEGMLNKLQSHVEREETTWRKQIQAKDEEIETLKEQNRLHHIIVQQSVQNGGTVSCAGNSSPDDHGVKFAFSCIERSLPLITEELQTKISELEETLLSEQQTKQELETECESLKSRLNFVGPVTLAKHTQFGNGGDFNGIEQVIEEKNRLAEQLANEQKRCQELNEEILRLRSTETLSVPTKIVQNHTSNGTSLESAELPNSASSSSVSPTTTKPRKNKKKKAAISN